MLRKTCHSCCLALILALYATVSPGAETVERSLSHEARLAAGATLRIDNLIGSVTLRSDGRGDEVRVVARVVAEGADLDQAEALADAVELVGESSDGASTVHVRYPVDRHPAFRLPRAEVDGLLSKWVTPLIRKNSIAAEYGGNTVEVGQLKGAAAVAVHVTVHVPLDVRLDVKQTFGQIHAAGLRGEIQLQGIEGGVRAEQIYGSLQVRSGGGAISVYKFHGDSLELQSRTGNMELVGIEAGRARLNSADGRIDGADVRAVSLSAETTTGAVKFEELEPASLAVTTVSGAVDLATQLKEIRDAHIRSGSGDVTLRVGRFAPFQVQADSVKGAVRTKGVKVDVDQREKTSARYQRGDGGAAFTVQTDSGSVLLRDM